MEHDTDVTELVERWFEDLFNKGDLAVANEILAPDVSYHGPSSLSPQAVAGPADIKEYVEVYQTAFPDLWYEVTAVQAGEAEIRVRWTATGTHESDLFGIEATGEAFSVEGIDIFEIAEGRITAVYAQWDTLKMVQELGVVPTVGLGAE